MASLGLAPDGGFSESKLGGKREYNDAGHVSFKRSSTTADTTEDDFEALKQAALERVHPHLRSRMAVYPATEEAQREGGEKVQVMRVDKMRRAQREDLVQRVMETREQDNERFLQRIADRMERVGIELSMVEVRWEHLTVETDVYVGARAQPTLINAARNFVQERILSTLKVHGNKRTFTILNDLNGFLKPAHYTLLLGPPGSGKSTLLKALCDKLNKNDLRVHGRITYNGHTFDEFDVQRTAAYIEQTDNHIAELTVRETLDFAARTQGVGHKYAELKELERREAEQGIQPDPAIEAFMKSAAIAGQKHSIVTEYLLRLLGLDIAADTLVGNQMLRGISGGQRKRVTAGEMIVGQKKTLFLDEISTGLDSSTTFSIVKAIRNFCHYRKGTVLMALLQPAPETFELFDDVMLLSEGIVVYHGSREEVVPFFEELGFKLPPRKGVADFLQEVTSKQDQKQYWAGDGPWSYMPVQTMAEVFWSGPIGLGIKAELAKPFTPKPATDDALLKREYALPPLQILRATLRRELMLLSRNWFLYTFRTCQVLIMAFITATLFFRTTLHPNNITDGTKYLAVLFFSLTHMMMNGFSEMSMTVERLPVFYKQRDNRFFPTWAFALPTTITRIPFSLVEAVLWSSLVYWVVGLASGADRFFAFMLLMFIMHNMAIGLFRIVGSVGRSMVVANTIGSCTMLVLFTLGGFVIAKNSIPGWWIWGYWISPFSYGQNAVSTNEFTAPRWQRPYDRNPSMTLGQAVLTSRDIYTSRVWTWIGVAVLCGFAVLFNICVVLALTYLSTYEKPNPVVPDEDPALKAERLLASPPAGSAPPPDLPPDLPKALAPPAKAAVIHSEPPTPVSLPPAMPLSPWSPGTVDRDRDMVGDDHQSQDAGGGVDGDTNRDHGQLDHAKGSSAIVSPLRHMSIREESVTPDAGNSLHDRNTDEHLPPSPDAQHKPTGGNISGSLSSIPGTQQSQTNLPTSGAARPAQQGSAQHNSSQQTAESASTEIQPQLADVTLNMDQISLAADMHSPMSRRLSAASTALQSFKSATSDMAAFDIEASAGSASHHDLDRMPTQQDVAKRGMILPFRPLAMTFHHITYTVQVDGKDLPLLRDVSGVFRPRVLTALMGVSGAGKTTLMDVLAGRKTGGKIEGDIRVDGHPKEQRTFARVSGYVEQNDIHSPRVTVREALIYSAMLRLGSDVNRQTLLEFVDEVMGLVELHPLRDAIIGLPGESGLSVEQRKRLTIAVELVANPSIIFMDEPTSGLDARAAAIVMRTVRNTVSTGRTVVCTIHQPSIDIFESFDELLLLKRGGQVIYFGPLGEQARYLIDYFSSIPGIKPIHDGYNPAAWMLEISTPGVEERLGIDFAEIYRNSELYRRNEQLIEELSQPRGEPLQFESKHSRSVPEQFAIILWKDHLTYWRSPDYNLIRLIVTILIALFFGSAMWNRGTRRGTVQDVYNVMGALYAANLFLGINNSITVQPVVAVERAVYYRERAAGMYSPLAYGLAQQAIELPYVLFQTIIYSAITYSMIHFEWTAAKFFWYLLFTFLTLLYFTYYGIMAVALTPSLQLAAVLSSFFYSFWNLFSGFLLPQPQIPGWWVWYYYLDPVAWTLYGLVASQLGGVTNEYITTYDGRTLSVAAFLKEQFDFHHYLLGVVVAAMCAFIAVFTAVTLLAVKILNFQKR